MSRSLECSALLAAARIQAGGGRPLTEAEINLCALEAYLLEQAEHLMRHGIADKEKLNERLDLARRNVVGGLSHERLQQMVTGATAGQKNRL